MYALNATTGALVWANYLTLGSVWVPPTVYNGVVYVQSALKEGSAGGFYAFNALNGATVWSYATASGDWSVPVLDATGANMYYSTGNPCLSSPPLPQNTPTTDGCSGSIFDINPTTGATVWSYHFPDYTGDDDAPATPVYAVVNGVPEVFEGVKNGVFYALDATTGAVIWQHDTGARGDAGIYSSAAYDNGMLYFGSYQSIIALNASTGAVVWNISPTGRVVSSPAIANGVVYITTESGYIEALDTATGALLWKYVVARQTIFSSPIVSNGAVYVPVSDGNLYCFTLGGA
jgi:outer membrane protein assembly factor BamB